MIDLEVLVGKGLGQGGRTALGFGKAAQDSVKTADFLLGDKMKERIVFQADRARVADCRGGAMRISSHPSETIAAPLIA